MSRKVIDEAPCRILELGTGDRHRIRIGRGIGRGERWLGTGADRVPSDY